MCYDNYYVDGGGIFINQGWYDEILFDWVWEVEVSILFFCFYVNWFCYIVIIEVDSSRVCIMDLFDQFWIVKFEG